MFMEVFNTNSKKKILFFSSIFLIAEDIYLENLDQNYIYKYFFILIIVNKEPTKNAVFVTSKMHFLVHSNIARHFNCTSNVSWMCEGL